MRVLNNTNIMFMRISNCIAKNIKIESAYGLYCVAWLKFRRTISEKARDNPVLIVGSAVADFTGCAMPVAEKMPE